MDRDDLRHAKTDHLRGEAKANKETEPFMKLNIVRPVAVECRPDPRCERGEDQEAKDKNPIEHSVVAPARIDDRKLDPKNVCGDPRDDLPHWGKTSRDRDIVSARKNQSRERDFSTQRIQAEIDNAEAERDSIQ